MTSTGPADPPTGPTLLVFPHAGGGAYRSWAPLLAPQIAVQAIRLPGREERFGEPPSNSIAELLEACRSQWEVVKDGRPYAIFGHSLGALMAFELARTLRREQLPAPTRLIVSGRVAPDVRRPGPILHALPEPELIAQLRLLGGTPEAVLANERLRQLVLPLLRADLGCDERYRYRPEPPLQIPITVLAGTADLRAPVPEVSKWAGQTEGPCTVQLIDGGHFFVIEARDHVLAQLRALLTLQPEPKPEPEPKPAPEPEPSPEPGSQWLRLGS
jgi:medium-chain acyl-[acyl-carrier-protein] hydrolase